MKSVCYLRYPSKIPAGKTVPQIAGAIDFLPTLTAFAEIPRIGDKPLDGRDLTPLLGETKEVSWPDCMIFSAWPQETSVRTQTHRLDAQGNPYDTTTDPGQKIPVNSKQPKLATKLKQAVADWKNEVFTNSDNKAEKRPFPVDYPEFPITMLPAHDGQASGGVKRSGSAPNCSYFIHWNTTDGKMKWNIDVHTAGKYQVTTDYTCPLDDVGSTIRLAFADARLDGKVTPGWDPPINTNQDSIPRQPMESQMKEFKTLALGEITLPAGKGELILSALGIPGKSVMDVRRVTLTLLK